MPYFAAIVTKEWCIKEERVLNTMLLEFDEREPLGENYKFFGRGNSPPPQKKMPGINTGGVIS